MRADIAPRRVVVDDTPIVLIDMDSWEPADYPFDRFIADSQLHGTGERIPAWTLEPDPVERFEIWGHVGYLLAWLLALALFMNWAVRS